MTVRRNRGVWPFGYSLLLLLGFLNPWLLIALGIGVVLGILARLGLRAARNRGRSPLSEDRQGRRRGIIIGGAVVLVLLTVPFIFLIALTPQFSACTEVQYSALYEGTAVGDTDAGTWTVQDQVTVPAAVLTELAEAPPPLGARTEDLAMKQIDLELVASGWSPGGTTNGEPRYMRTRTEPLEVPWWPLLSTSELTVPSPGWGPCGRRVVLVPGDDSKLTLKVPADLIVHTFPTSEGEDMLNGEWRWEVSADSGATDTNVVRVQLASPLVRNEVTAKAAEWSLSSALLWVMAILGGIFNDQAKEILGGPIRRLFELLHLRKPETKEEKAAQ